MKTMHLAVISISKSKVYNWDGTVILCTRGPSPGEDSRLRFINRVADMVAAVK
jgi:hypothetical protein